MLAYYGYTISPNQMETVEGFLICRNVPIARTGEMEYLESELKQDGDISKVVSQSRMNIRLNFSHRTTVPSMPEGTPRTSGREKGNGRDM